MRMSCPNCGSGMTVVSERECGEGKAKTHEIEFVCRRCRKKETKVISIIEKKTPRRIVLED